MSWNKTPEETITDIVHFLNIAFDTTYSETAELFGVSTWLVSNLARKYLSKEVLALRYSLVNKRAKMGDKNPMKGKTRLKHHNSKVKTVVCGYETEWAPDWWQGHQPKTGRCYVHQRVYCEANNLTAVPKNYVIHHKDEDKLNNSLDNLIMMTRKQHAQIHCVNNLLRTCNDYPQVGVESRALEAQSILFKDGDIV